MRLGFQLGRYEDPRVWLVPLLGALTLIDRQARVLVPSTRSVYKSGVRYQQEGESRVMVPCSAGMCVEVRPCECWQDTPTLHCAQEGDCEDLACDRAAELQLQGLDCVAWPLIPPPKDGRRIIHIVVGYQGRIYEDPSARLGMYVPPGFPGEGDPLT